MWINIVACKIAYPQVAIGKLALISNGLATVFKCFINYYSSPLLVWTCATGCSTSIPIDIQHSWKTCYKFTNIIKTNFLNRIIWEVSS